MNTQLQNIINMFDALDKAISKGPLADRDEQAELTMDAENVPPGLVGDVLIDGFEPNLGQRGGPHHLD